MQWGCTLGGVTFTPRTAVGVDAYGNAMFVVAAEATVVSLAQILQHIGAVRGMEFDNFTAVYEKSPGPVTVPFG